jgi:long-subunit fatty acid transport protein
MNRYTLAAVATIAGAGAAVAGGLDRSNQPITALFDPPGTLAFGLSYVNPDLTGSDLGATPGSYDAGRSYTTYSWSFANRLNDRVSYAIIGDQPFGADIFYDDDPRRSALGGTEADLTSDAISFLGRYEITNRFSVHGGIRAQRAGGDIALNGVAYQAALGARTLGAALGAAAAAGEPVSAGLLQGLGADAPTVLSGVALANPTGDPTVAAVESQIRAIQTPPGQRTFAETVNDIQGFTSTDGYAVNVEQDWGVGVTLGAAYEIPEIALRLAITYQSEVSHDTRAIETAKLFPDTAVAGDLNFSTPQSVNVDFQTGLNNRTLLTAGLRWTDWGDFDVIPQQLGTDLADIDDTYRWTVGVARRFNENLVGLASVTYEKERNSDSVSPLGPTDGQIGLSLGARYTAGALNVSGGINYTKIGDAFPGVAGRPVAAFEDNDAVGVGLRVSYEF